MTVEVGTKVSGKVSGITNFGAFVDLGEKQTGLVHISEVSNNYVKDIHDVLKVGDEVQVKVLKIGDDGKISLSIKQAMPKPKKNESTSRQNNNHQGNHQRFHGNKSNHQNHSKKDFDTLLAGFLKESDERLTSLKRNTDGKRGGRGGRRS
ncbi:S1 domain-containing RNA-binding protein [Ligilactobacillus cholophilus]|uniref:S1 domain-containing RNA-binding protein n=1 Tax=Ligilactobacillus cholophilus TaxID=3050131 RepID=UPI0025B08385|nr:S1 domain-containing RNA-binding protein [Ligilactobacillus cholophilus]